MRNLFAHRPLIAGDQLAPGYQHLREPLFAFSILPPEWRQNLLEHLVVFLIQPWAALPAQPPHRIEAISPLAQVHNALRCALRCARQQMIQAPADLHPLLADLRHIEQFL
eukprot:8853331-Pyramimonas_sp.AAC.1